MTLGEILDWVNTSTLQSDLCSDDALDRYEIDKMRKKTLQVKRRMTETVGTGNQQDSLTSHTVDMFLANSILWEKYKTS